MTINAPRMTWSLFGDSVILLFLLAQAADGCLTYVGVSTLGLHIESNPLLLALMSPFGLGTAVASAKVLASVLGVSLHRLGVHWALATLTGIYLCAAVLPWFCILLISQ